MAAFSLEMATLSLGPFERWKGKAPRVQGCRIVARRGLEIA